MNFHQLIEALPNWLVFAFVVVNDSLPHATDELDAIYLRYTG